MNSKTNYKKGISLIALVITIVVLIILSATVILNFRDTNIIDQAEHAAERQKVAFLQEKITLEKQNTLLEKFGSTQTNGTTQTKTVTVQELLNVTEEDALNIVTANSIPANMPAGTYYELDENRYSSRLRDTRIDLALMSRGIDRENDLVSDTYVVSENFTVYYIIDGKTGVPELPINDERVSELLDVIIYNWEINGPEVLELKKELHIENTQGDSFLQIAIIFVDEISKKGYVYFPACNRMYNLNIGNFTYASKEEIPRTYAYIEKISQIITELETAFVEKLTVEEIQQKYNDGTLNEYILTNCKSIKSVETRWRSWNKYEYVFVDDIGFEFDGKTYNDFCDDDTFVFLADESGKIVDVYLGGGA